jgi:SulP family sulfate permease
VPTGLPDLHLNFWGVFTQTDHLMLIVEFAFTLAALGAIDSLLTSIVADNLTKTKHNSDQELIGQGIGNMGAALIGGLPGAGATMRTVINAQSGGKTKISGVIAGLLLLAILLGLGPLVGQIPNAVLAGILITVGIGIIDYKGFKHIRTIPRTDASVMITVLLLTVFVGLLEAVAIGMVMAALLFMKKISDVVDHRTDTAPLREFAREISWRDEGDIVDRIGDKIYIKHLNGPLFFGFAARFQDMIKALPDIKVVIIRMDRVPYIDQSGLYAMEEAILELEGKGIAVVFTGLHGQPEDMLRRINIVPGLVDERYSFTNFGDCTAWLYTYLQGDGKIDDLFHHQSNGNFGMVFTPPEFREI